jgi:RsiW-degrading membrane proteinase PrsW (M82 family)
MFCHEEFDEWYDGILYGVMIGLGFAFIENIFYFINLYPVEGGSIIILRSLLSMPAHALECGIMGYFLGKAKFTEEQQKFPLLLSLALIIPVALHGFFDFVLIYYRINMQWLCVPTVIVMWIKVLQMKRVTQRTVVF